LVGAFRFVVVPLLLVGEEFDEHEDEDGFREDGVINPEVVTSYSGAQQENVCWCCDEEK
jgi:hypothetical protein